MRHDHDGQPFFRDDEQATERLPLRNATSSGGVRIVHGDKLLEEKLAGDFRMNSRQLQKLGVPEACVKSAIAAIQIAMKAGDQKGKQIKQLIKSVLERPEDFTGDEHFGQFAKDVIADREFVRPEPIAYRTWGSEIDEASHAQMRQACACRWPLVLP